MYKTAKIIFKPLTDNEENMQSGIRNILTSLVYNGQIISKYVVEKRGNCFVATVTATGEDALEKENHSNFAEGYIDYFDIETQLLGDAPFMAEPCSCEKHSYLVLRHEPGTFTSPVLCGDCGREIPLYKLPNIEEKDENFHIVTWQKMYEDICELYITSLSDRFTKRQITDCNSQINKLGAKNAGRLEERTGIPVYLFVNSPMTDWYSRRNTVKKLESCPKCGGTFRKLADSAVDKVCDKCRLAFMEYVDI